MGINKLVDMFMGNPAPLEQKVQRDQQGQPPGGLPKDLEEAIALQKIQEKRNAMQNQQAMQAGGPQPTIVEKLRQLLNPQPQPQAEPPQMAQGAPQGPPQGMPPGMPQGMPQQPVQAAHGGSIAQLMSNLGRHYERGGIVAFAEGDQVEEPQDNPMRDYVSSLSAARSLRPEEEILRKAMAQDKEQIRRDEIARINEMIGKPDNSAILETIAALKGKREKAQANADPLMDLLGGIASARPGQQWWQSGVAGSEAAANKAAQREAADTAYLEQILGHQQKVSDSDRAYKSQLYTGSSAAAERAAKEVYDAALAANKSYHEAEQLAQQERLKVMELDQQRDLEGKKLAVQKAQVAAMNKPETYEKIYAELQRLNPNASKADLLTQASIMSGINRTESVDAKNSKAYIDAKDKIDARFLHLINDTPYGQGKKKLYDDAIRELDATFKVGGGSMKTSAPTVAPIPPGAGPNDLTPGTVYQTSKGAAKWNGKAFEPV
jgi:hypothetical protein